MQVYQEDALLIALAAGCKWGQRSDPVWCSVKEFVPKAISMGGTYLLAFRQDTWKRLVQCSKRHQKLY